MIICSLDAAGAGTCGTNPPPSGDPVVSGTWSEQVSPDPTYSIDDTVGDAICSFSGANWSCELPASGTSFIIKIEGYGRNNKNRWACLTPFVAGAVSTVDQTDADAYTLIDLSLLDPATTYNINIQPAACPSSA